MALVLVHTNVLAYAHDGGEFQKQKQAIRVLEHLQVTGSGRLSAQTLAGFFRATTQDRRPVLTIEEVSGQMVAFAHSWPVLEITAQVVLEAARGVRDHQMSSWDAQVWATARLNQTPIVFSEDFTPPREYRRSWLSPQERVTDGRFCFAR